MGILAGFLHQAAVGFRPQGEHIAAGDELGEGAAFDLDGAVGEIDAGNEPFQAGEGAFQFFQQGGGVLQGLFALLHQDIIIKTIAELFDAAVEIGTLLQGFGQFHIWFLHFALNNPGLL